jgi:hypothetical protein
MIDWKGLLLWSNQFYAIAAALLSIESCLQILHVFPNWTTVLCVYLSTLLYYTQAYLFENSNIHCEERFKWYQKHRVYLYIRQVVCIVVLVFVFTSKYNLLFLLKTTQFKFLFFTTCLIAILYYLPVAKFFKNATNFEKGLQAWLKSTCIAWVWVVVTFFIPINFEPIFLNQVKVITTATKIYAVHNFIFILILAILFDIKDTTADLKIKRNTIATLYSNLYILNRIVPFFLFLNFTLIIYLFIISNFNLALLLAQLFVGILIFIVSRKINKFTTIVTHILSIDGMLVIKAILGILFVKL